MSKLSGMIRAHKDRNRVGSRKNAVYKIECENCEKCYVGQTKRQLKTRLNEHRSMSIIFGEIQTLNRLLQITKWKVDMSLG
ncbi:hypothetical protein P5V15_001118 [Pogonomyrmex californicus]